MVHSPTDIETKQRTSSAAHHARRHGNRDKIISLIRFPVTVKALLCQLLLTELAEFATAIHSYTQLYD